MIVLKELRLPGKDHISKQAGLRSRLTLHK
jgi:hypothetical protein